MMLTVFLCFLLGVGPAMIITVADKDVNHPDIHICFDILFWGSVVANPIIYAFMNNQYRQAISQQIFCKKPNQRSKLTYKKSNNSMASVKKNETNLTSPQSTITDLSPPQSPM